MDGVEESSTFFCQDGWPQETVSPAAGGSADRDAAEAHLRGAGPPPLTHWLPSEREVSATPYQIAARYQNVICSS